MTRVGRNDTIPCWGEIAIAFSIPVADTSIRFDISPDPGTVYSTQIINTTHDTAIITVSQMLPGDTRLVISPGMPIHAENGTEIRPGNDSIVVHTYPREDEPNDAPGLAGTLREMICGEILPGNDTDYFWVPDSNISVLHVVTDGDGLCLLFRDSTGQDIAAAACKDTVIIPAGPARAVHAVAYSKSGRMFHYRICVVRP